MARCIELYNSKDVQKSVGYTTMVPSPGAYNVFTAVDKNIHRHKRKVLSQSFSDQCIREFEPKILEQANTFVRRLMPAGHLVDTIGEWSTVFDMTECCRHLGYDIMGEFGFGQSFELQTSEKNRFLIEAVIATIRKAGAYVQYPALQKLHLEQLLYFHGMQRREKYLRLMSEMVQSRVAAGKSARKDMFSFLVDAKDPDTGVGFTTDELWAESRFLLIAGADTTSTAMAGILFYLAAYPSCQQELAREIRSSFGSAFDIRSGPKLSACQYLRACIDEAMRMSPPISSTLWREATLNSCIGGELVAKGTDVGISPYAIHHNEDLFPDSFTFRPERWIVSDDNPKEVIDKLRHTFSVFSLGSRACAGKNMAYVELSDSIAKTIWYFDLQSADGTLASLGGGAVGAKYGRHRQREFQLREHLTCNHNGPFLRFRVRKGVGQKDLALLDQG